MTADTPKVSKWGALRQQIETLTEQNLTLRSQEEVRERRIRELEHENTLLKAASTAAPAEYWRIRDGLVRTATQLHAAAEIYSLGYSSLVNYVKGAAAIAEGALTPRGTKV